MARRIMPIQAASLLETQQAVGVIAGIVDILLAIWNAIASVFWPKE